MVSSMIMHNMKNMCPKKNKIKNIVHYYNGEGIYFNRYIVAVEIMAKYVPVFGFWAFLDYKPTNSP